jgi:hypothetical protein
LLPSFQTARLGSTTPAPPASFPIPIIIFFIKTYFMQSWNLSILEKFRLPTISAHFLESFVTNPPLSNQMVLLTLIDPVNLCQISKKEDTHELSRLNRLHEFLL